MSMKGIVVACGSICFLLAHTASADETIVRAATLPFASAEQEVTYHPSLREYERARDETLAKLRRGDASSYVNPKDGPWMLVQTTVEIGIEIKGIGSSEGRKNVRQISAAEEALYVFEHQQK
jgi:hypothetical protein